LTGTRQCTKCKDLNFCEEVKPGGGKGTSLLMLMYSKNSMKYDKFSLIFSNYKQRLISLKPFNIFTEMFVHSLMSAIILRGTLHTKDHINAGMTLHKCRWLHISCKGTKDEYLHPLSSSQEIATALLKCTIRSVL
jgi:hypothetical protein